MILGLFKISGHSMLPFLKPQDRIIISSVPYFFGKPKIGDVVAFKNNGKVIIKRITKILNGKIIVEGDNKNDSIQIEPIGKSSIIGKLIYKI